jgi:bifunctional NMN adenylyltransferase/nudix hydrolase
MKPNLLSLDMNKNVPEEKRKDYEIGIIIGRFQVHHLHSAHTHLIENVISNHKKVIIFLGVSPLISTKKNPLDFTARKRMINEKYPEVNVLQLPDKRTDEEWSKNLDQRIKEVFPIGQVLLYGGRDSFIPHYKGHFDVTELHQDVYVSGTEIRKEASEEIVSSEKWRAGVIYQAYNRYPVSYQTVDIAVLDTSKDRPERFLLARKPGEDLYRFIGGFVDPSDENLEVAARREFKEETGSNAEIGKCKYLASFRVDDWRYRSETDKIMTSLFVATWQFGTITPSDDISELRWFLVEELQKKGFIEKTIVEEHRPLARTFLSFINERQEEENTQRIDEVEFEHNMKETARV